MITNLLLTGQLMTSLVTISLQDNVETRATCYEYVDSSKEATITQEELEADYFSDNVEFIAQLDSDFPDDDQQMMALILVQYLSTIAQYPLMDFGVGCTDELTLQNQRSNFEEYLYTLDLSGIPSLAGIQFMRWGIGRLIDDAFELVGRAANKVSRVVSARSLRKIEQRQAKDFAEAVLLDHGDKLGTWGQSTARGIIDDVLENLPEGATDAQRRIAIREIERRIAAEAHRFTTQ